MAWTKSNSQQTEIKKQDQEAGAVSRKSNPVLPADYRLPLPPAPVSCPFLLLLSVQQRAAKFGDGLRGRVVLVRVAEVEDFDGEANHLAQVDEIVVQALK